MAQRDPLVEYQREGFLLFEAMNEAEVENPPRHLVLGAFGIDAVTSKLKASLAEIEQWRDTGLATDFPQAPMKEPA